MVDLNRMVYIHKWSPIGYRSSAGQGSLPALSSHAAIINTYKELGFLITCTRTTNIYNEHGKHNKQVSKQVRDLDKFVEQEWILENALNGFNENGAEIKDRHMLTHPTQHFIDVIQRFIVALILQHTYCILTTTTTTAVK